MTATQSGRAMLEAYVDALVARGNYGEYLDDGVVVEVVGTGQTAEGRAAVEGMIRYLHEQVFDGKPELKTLVVDGDQAAIEADFVGRHTAEFAGIPASGREVRVPYSVHYSLANGRIKALRIYGLANDLIQVLQS
jgi:predicted ester cyclase